MSPRGVAVAALGLTGWLAAGCGGRGAPEPFVNRNEEGLLVGSFDHAELTEFLVAHELPPLDRPLAGIEAGIAESLGGAFAALDEVAGAESYGRVAMILDYIHCTPTARAAYARAEALAPLDARWPHLGGRLDALGGDAGSAERSFRRAIELRPRYAPTHVRLGRLLASANRIDDAEAEFTTAIALAPQAAVGHRELGRIAARRGRWEEACAHLERARERAPSDGQVHALLGRTYAALGDGERARAHARRAGPDGDEGEVLMDPMLVDRMRLSGSLLYERRTAQRHFAGGRIDEMIASLERVVARDSSDVGTVVDLLTALAGTGRGSDADRLGAWARDRFSEHPAPFEATARVAVSRGNLAGALRWTEASLQRDPGYGRAHATRAVALVNSGRLEEAATAAANATAADPTDVASCQLQVEVLASLGRPQEALAALRRGVEENPDSSELAALWQRATAAGNGRR